MRLTLPGKLFQYGTVCVERTLKIQDRRTGKESVDRQCSGKCDMESHRLLSGLQRHSRTREKQREHHGIQDRTATVTQDRAFGMSQRKQTFFKFVQIASGAHLYANPTSGMCRGKPNVRSFV